MTDPAGHPRPASRDVTVALAPASSPETKTLLGGRLAGSVRTDIAAVFSVFTTRASR
jgi:hypothetical protein